MVKSSNKHTGMLAVGCIVIWGVFLYFTFHQPVSKDPVFEVYSNINKVYQNFEIDYLSYVKTATDYEGNDLKDHTHITYTPIDNTKLGTYNVEYTLTDDHNRSVTRTVRIKIEAYPGASNVSTDPGASYISEEELRDKINGTQGGT